MFKRVDKKRKKREEEEELGLDQEMKEIMGLNDTDSEESASESDSNSDAEQSDEEDMEEVVEDSEDDGDDEETEDVDAGEDDQPPISLSEALRDPVYVVSLDPDVRACILCKGKIIKGTPMSQVHKTSTTHKRRFDRFKSLSASIDRHADAWQIARVIRQEGSTQNHPDAEDGISKRALKRIAKQASIKEKRTLHKKLRAKAKAKKAPKGTGISHPQDADVKESLGNKPPEQTKAGVIASAIGTNEEREKAIKSKLHDMKGLDASPLRPLEPQKKKRKVQNDSTVAPASQRTSRRWQEKPHRKPKIPRKKRTNKS